MEFNIDITPISYYKYLTQNRFRKYITKEGRVYKKALEDVFIDYMIAPMGLAGDDSIGKDRPIYTEDVSVRIELYLDNKRKNDIDNFVKPILDCMSEIIFVDDRQVTELIARKHYDKYNPRLLIFVDKIAP